MTSRHRPVEVQRADVLFLNPTPVTHETCYFLVVLLLCLVHSTPCFFFILFHTQIKAHPLLWCYFLIVCDIGLHSLSLHLPLSLSLTHRITAPPTPW